MRLNSFTYTKADGSVSARDVVEVSKPNKFLTGYDVSEMGAEDFALFSKEYNELLDRQKQETLELLAKFDISKSYRQFDPEKMTEVSVEHV